MNYERLLKDQLIKKQNPDLAQIRIQTKALRSGAGRDYLT